MSYSISQASMDTITLGPMTLDIEKSAVEKKHKFPGTDIRITPANGGYIISISQSSDYIHTRSEPDLYIISEDQDLGTELGKIITMSNLKREHK